MPDRPLRSPDAVWDSIKSRLDEHWQSQFRATVKNTLFWVTMIGGPIVTIVGGVVAWIIKDETVRNDLWRNVFKIEGQFDKLPVQAALKAPLLSNLQEREVQEALRTHFQNYLFAATDIFDSQAPLKTKGEQIFNAKMDEKLNGQISNLSFTYSYGTSFNLTHQAPAKTYALKFKKVSGSTADIDCYAVYPSENKVRPTIYMDINNIDPKPPKTLSPDPKLYSGEGHIHLEADNRRYFQDPSQVQDVQTIAFHADDHAEFLGAIDLQCTISVTVPARVAQTADAH